jgi:hypothetical protein
MTPRLAISPVRFRGQLAPFGWALLALVTPLAAVSAAHAQTVTVDQGRFLLTWQGQDAGSESFAIRQTGSGAMAEVVATAEIRTRDARGEAQLLPLLQMTGSAMVVTSYQLRVSGDREEEVALTLTDRRFLSRVRSAQGEREREYPATPESVVIDPLIVHSFHVVVARFFEGQSSVPAIAPRDNQRFDLRIRETSAATTVSIGGRAVQARLLEVEGGSLRAQLWVDGQGRILQMIQPDAGRVATRESLP